MSLIGNPQTNEEAWDTIEQLLALTMGMRREHCEVLAWDGFSRSKVDELPPLPSEDAIVRQLTGISEVEIRLRLRSPEQALRFAEETARRLLALAAGDAQEGA